MNKSAQAAHSTADDKTTWLLVQLRPGGELLAESNLQRQGFRVFAPKTLRTQRRSGRFREELKPLFPGYMFVGVPAGCGGWRSIRGTLGVRSLVSFGTGAPATVRDELIRLLMGRCNEQGRLQPQTFSEGEVVRIVAGPLSRFVAKVESIPSERRIWILLDILGESRRISLDPCDLEPGAAAR